MLLAIAVAFVSVGLGVLLGLARTRTRVALGAVRTFALIAALATVALELLPGAAARGGLAALLVFAVAATLPWALETIGGRVGAQRSPGLRLEMGYLALLVHHVADGLGLGAYTGTGHDDHVHWDVMVSIGGHTVPVTAVVVLAFARRASRGAAAARGAGFAVAIVAGILLARAIPAASFEAFEPYVTAAVGGLLLHVATHDWLEDVPVSRGARLLDLAAGAAGVALVVASTAAHDHHGGAVHEAPDDVVSTAARLLLRYAPSVLAAVVLGALLARSAPPRVGPGQGLGAALRAALLGATVGAGPERGFALATRVGPGRPSPAAVALALGAGGIGLETLAVSANAFGPPFAGAWVALAVVAIAIVAVAARGAAASPVGAAGEDTAHDGAGPGARPRVATALEDGVARSGAALAVGVVAAAVLAVTVNDGALATLSIPKVDVLVLPLVAAALGAPPLALVPALLVLVDKGANAPAALAALAVAAASRRSVTRWASVPVRAIAVAVAAAAAAAYALSWLGWPASPARSRPTTALDPIGLASAAALGALALAGTWRRGVRPWLAASLDARAHHHHGPCFEESAGPGHDHHEAARAPRST